MAEIVSSVSGPTKRRNHLTGFAMPYSLETWKLGCHPETTPKSGWWRRDGANWRCAATCGYRVIEASGRSENAEVTTIRAINHGRHHDEFSFSRTFGLIASSFRTRAALQAKILAFHN